MKNHPSFVAKKAAATADHGDHGPPRGWPSIFAFHNLAFALPWRRPKSIPGLGGESSAWSAYKKYGSNMFGATLTLFRA